MEYVTISKWCQNWLREEYHTEAAYLPNGIDPSFYPKRGRDLQGKIRILIEGDCSAEHKNVDESFRIVEQLDLEKFEIWYMSYNGNPKSWYRVGPLLHRVPYEKTPEVYAACDILLKTSLLESFSYPPLEMMASGGYVVAVPNGGNLEYLKGWGKLYSLSAGKISRRQKRRLSVSDRCGTEEKTGYGSRRDGKGKKLEKNRTTDFRTVSWKINKQQKGLSH